MRRRQVGIGPFRLLLVSETPGFVVDISTIYIVGGIASVQTVWAFFMDNHLPVYLGL